MGTHETILDIINSENVAKAIRRIDRTQNKDVLAGIVLMDTDQNSIKLRALTRLYRELLNGAYMELVSELIFLCYTTDIYALRINIVKFLEHPTVLRYLQNKEKNPEVFDLITKKLSTIWERFYLDSINKN